MRNEMLSDRTAKQRRHTINHAERITAQISPELFSRACFWLRICTGVQSENPPC